MPRLPENFQPSKLQSRKQVCGTQECQKQHRTSIANRKISTGHEFREGCWESPRKWRVAARRSQASSACSIHSMACARESLWEAYLRDMADTDRSLAPQISELLELIRQYAAQGCRQFDGKSRGCATRG